MDDKVKVVMLCGDGKSSRIMYNALAPHANIQCVIIEKKNRITLLKKRIIKLGIITVIGQIVFILVNKLIAQASKGRIKQLISYYGLSDIAIPEGITRTVNSINNEETISILRKYKTDAVVVNGTRIISKKVLSSVNTPFINTHMGITPRYRGVHGGYWALAKGDRENCGVTIHLVDQGIDTGGVLYQETISIEKIDNFNTYPIHQISKAIPLMISALNDVKGSHINVKQGVLPSNLWYHPTIFEYIQHWIQRGIK